MFQGTIFAKLDEKGRLLVPQRLREPLFESSTDRAVTIARHPDGCLVVYTRARWEEKCSKLAELPFAARAFVRFVLGSAVTVTADKSGRLLIPAELRELARLGRSVALIGMGGYLEIWNRDQLAACEAEALEGPFDVGDFTF